MVDKSKKTIFQKHSSVKGLQTSSKKIAIFFVKPLWKLNESKTYDDTHILEVL